MKQLESHALGKPEERVEQVYEEPEQLQAMRTMTPEARRILLRQMNEAEQQARSSSEHSWRPADQSPNGMVAVAATPTSWLADAIPATSKRTLDSRAPVWEDRPARPLAARAECRPQANEQNEGERRPSACDPGDCGPVYSSGARALTQVTTGRRESQ